MFLFQFIQKRKLGDAKAEYKRVIEDAKLEAKTLRKDALLEAKEEQIRLRNEFEKKSNELESERREHRSEVSKDTVRLNHKEDMLNKKEDALDKKLESIDVLKKDYEDRQKQLNEIEVSLLSQQDKMLKELEKVSGLSKDEAKAQLIEAIRDEAKHDAAVIIKEIEKEAKEEGEKRAKNIVALAIQRCAVDQASEATVSVVELPNEEMKGRIIGRVGRNIKALESATGVDVIIDDTPDVVTLTGFDPIRREVARQTLQKLIADGRIHPGRIEEVADRVRKDLDATVKEAGEGAVFDAGLYGVHPEIIKLLGRMKFRTSYGQNVLKHSLEVSHLAGLLAAELGADIKIAKRAGLLHDLGKSVDHEYEGTHVQIGVELARKYKENERVVHCIAAHHGDTEANTIEAIIVQASDAISSARPGARRESLEFYVKRLEKLETIANSFAGVEQSFAIQAGREIRVIVKPDKVDDSATILMAKEIAKKLELELEYPGQIKVNVIRELRSVEYAK
ncbi:MAG: ribonuclease Y [Firmicutes bacterium]|nr:ribonuclease Y [Bacillota bacterium]